MDRSICASMLVWCKLFITMKSFMAALPLLLAASLANAQTNADTNTVIPLWPDGAPGALGKTDKDTPTLTVYLPDKEKATGAALVICPGGGYGGLARHEGHDYALWLNDNGVTCFV